MPFVIMVFVDVKLVTMQGMGHAGKLSNHLTKSKIVGIDVKNLVSIPILLVTLITITNA